MEMQELEMKQSDKLIKDVSVKLQETQHLKLQTEERLASKREILEQKKSELEKIIQETEKEEEVLAKKSEKSKAKVEERLLVAYDRIRASYRNGLAVVPVLRNSCGGCYNVIPPQRQSEIAQRKKIIVCEHCGRILVDNDLNEAVSPE